METKLTQEVMNVIKDKLPSRVINILQDIFTEYEGLKADYTLLKPPMEESIEKYNKLHKQFDELHKLKLRKDALDSQEKELEKRELEIKLKDQEVKFAHYKTSLMRECFSLVFRNTEVRETIHDSEDQSYADEQGMSHYKNVNKSYDKTKKKE